jgi:transcriptional adapter 2-alpha
MELNGIVFGGKKKKVSCSYCGRDVTMLCRVHCAVCPDFKLCNDCFSVGVRLLPHEPSHAYRVVDCLDVPIFAKDWTASEELLLLEGIERCGAGNWKTIADYINSSVVPQGVGKSHKQVEEHYWERYMGVHGNCLPAKYVAASGELADTAPVLQDKDANRCAVVHGYKLGEAVVRDRPVSNSLLPPVNSSSSSSSNLAHQSDSQKDKKFDRSHGHDKGQDASKPGAAADRAEELRLRHLALPGADLQGFLPLREDFDVEHDNDAELLLAEMEFRYVCDQPFSRIHHTPHKPSTS